MDMIRIPWPKWEIVKKLGNGSFGSVYEIERNDEFGNTEKAALKVISIPKEDSEIDALMANGYDDASITEYFKTSLHSIVSEYALMTQLKSHPNIVSCEDREAVRQENGIGWDVYIRMELLIPFVKYIRGLEMTEAEIEKLGRDMCSALIACHDKNIIHRDIKPQNIFATEYGAFKLGDFGVARIMSHTTNATKTGTPYYMAPEVCKDEKYGKEADIYSLGMVMYWLLNNRRLPFEPNDHLPTALEKEQAYKERVSSTEIQPPENGSAMLKRIVLKALAYNPDQRYRTAAEMLEDLNSVHQTPENTDDDTAFELSESGNTEPTAKSEEDDSQLSKTVGLLWNGENKTIGKMWENDAVREPKQDETIDGNPLEEIIVDSAEIINEPHTVVSQFTWDHITAITAGAAYLTGLKEDGTVVSIGFSDIIQNYFSGKKNIKAVISGGLDRVFALKKDGTVIAFDFTADLYDWTDIVAIAAGLDHTIGLKKDGTVVTKGSNDYHQCDVGSWKEIMAVAAGDHHTVGLRNDGTVVTAGDNKYGQCNVSDWNNICAISAKSNQTVGLRKNGTVVSTRGDFSAWKDIISIAVSDYDVVGIRRDGTVVAMRNKKSVSGWKDIIAVDTDLAYIVGLKSDGTVLMAGDFQLKNDGSRNYIVKSDGMVCSAEEPLQKNKEPSKESITRYLKESLSTKIEDNVLKLCKVTDETYRIPQNVTEIGDGAFAGNLKIKHVIGNNHIKRIGAHAFDGCILLESVSDFDGLETIAESAFFECVRLEKIHIPETVKEIGEQAFDGCVSLTDLGSGLNIERVCDGVFFGCVSLNRVSFSNTLKTIGSFSFACCYSLTDMKFPASLNEIGASAFLNCINLEHIDLSRNCECDPDAFNGCTKLMYPQRTVANDIDDDSVTIEVLNEISAMSLDELSTEFFDEIKDEEIEESRRNVRIIDGKFGISDENDRQLLFYTGNDENVVIPKDVIFSDMPVFMPKWHTAIMMALGFEHRSDSENFNYTVKSIQYDGKIYEMEAIITSVFTCPNLERFIVSPEFFKEFKDDIDQYLLRAVFGITDPIEVKRICRLLFPNPDAKTELPRNIWNLSGDTLVSVDFDYNPSKLVIPDQIKQIKSKAIPADSTFETIVLPEGMTEIDESLCKGSLHLKEVILPEGLKRINSHAFSDCAELEKCILPKSIRYIGDQVFDNCPKLDLKAAFSKFKKNNKALQIENSKLKIKLINAHVFQINDFFSGTDTITVPEGITEISSYSFMSNLYLKKVELPGTVTRIGKGAFRGCINLKKINIPESVTEIDEDAFAECHNLDLSYLQEHSPHYKNLAGTAGMRSIEQIRQIRLQNGVCQYCGGRITGILLRRCAVCGKMTV